MAAPPLEVCPCSPRLLLRHEAGRIKVFAKSDWSRVGTVELDARERVQSVQIEPAHRRQGFATEVLSVLPPQSWPDQIASPPEAPAIAWLNAAGFTTADDGWRAPKPGTHAEESDRDYARRVKRWHHQLGISPNYGKQRKLNTIREPRELAHVGPDCFERALYLQPGTARAWQEMAAAADEQGIELQPVSGFRSLDYQGRILKRNVDQGRDIEELLKVSAAPGFSEHHSGRALDISSPDVRPLSESFETTAAFSWLSTNAGDYGFGLSYPRNNPHGLVYEPWHWAFLD